ncbi:uncharacterized protein F4812DRAFT_459946 [Daldinia caldariorum]|uniref:uncharacterized protein n=1 Tax=Daldinia caldariorum TaxID=326644 RepID=UPI0020074922|nr:uncharacterized protein F4812DRAFT_459946 [Daldinia caldariorum]KAI1467100.1 hypothetical protein F4812DRAFT_459946 [Daldinia caldariorum]
MPTYKNLEDSPETMNRIAEQSEREVNTYEAKTGANRTAPSDEAGVDTRVEKKFQGANVRYNPELCTNASWNKRIPPEEGGVLDARGRVSRGEHFEGEGGPEDKLAIEQREFGGNNEFNVSGYQRRERGWASPKDPVPRKVDVQPDKWDEGKEAKLANIADKKPVPIKDHVKGSEYYTPEDVPGSIAAEGYEPPESVVQSSRDAEKYRDE